MKEDVERLKRELSKAESVEMELRKTSDYQSRTISEYQILRDQVSNSLISYNPILAYFSLILLWKISGNRCTKRFS